MERQRGAKPDCRVIRRDIHAELLDVHACQFRLTSLVCQFKLTRRAAAPECPDGRAEDAILWLGVTANTTRVRPDFPGTAGKPPTKMDRRAASHCPKDSDLWHLMSEF
jgi:hypothetical protein